MGCELNTPLFVFIITIWSAGVKSKTELMPLLITFHDNSLSFVSRSSYTRLSWVLSRNFSLSSVCWWWCIKYNNKQLSIYQTCLASEHLPSSSVACKLPSNWHLFRGSGFPVTIISTWIVWVSEPNGGGEEEESHASCWELNPYTHTCTQANKHFSDAASWFAACTHNWSNWGVVKEAASLISFCLPHCPAAFTRNSPHRSLPLSLSVHLLHSLLLSSWDSCAREKRQAFTQTQAMTWI